MANILSKIFGSKADKKEAEAEFVTYSREDLYNQIFFALTGQVKYDPTDDPAQLINEGYINNDVVYSTMNVLINRATIPKLKVYKGKGADREEVLDNEMLELIMTPNSSACYEDIIEQWLINKKITGFCPFYVFKPSGGINAGKPTAFYTLPPQRFSAEGSGDYTNPIKWYLCDVIMEEKIPPEDVFISRYHDPRVYDDAGNIIFGLSSLRAALIQVRKNNAANETEYKQFADGMVKSLMGTDTDIQLNEQQIRNLDTRIKREAKEKKGILPTFVGLPLKNIPVGSSVSELNTLGSTEAGRRAISACFGVPSRIINDPEGSTYSNRKEDEKSIWSNGLMRDMNRLAKEFTKVFLKPYPEYADMYFEYDYTDVDALQDDLKEKVDWMTKANYTANEIREATGMDSIDEDLMNEPLFMNNSTPLSELPYNTNLNLEG